MPSTPPSQPRTSQHSHPARPAPSLRTCLTTGPPTCTSAHAMAPTSASLRSPTVFWAAPSAASPSTTRRRARTRRRPSSTASACSSGTRCAARAGSRRRAASGASAVPISRATTSRRARIHGWTLRASPLDPASAASVPTSTSRRAGTGRAWTRPTTGNTLRTRWWAHRPLPRVGLEPARRVIRSKSRNSCWRYAISACRLPVLASSLSSAWLCVFVVPSVHA